MKYTPHTEEDRQEMLAAIGVERIEDLFHDVPASVRFPDLDLPPGISELEARQHFTRMAARNATLNDHPCFLGAGAYHHYTPAVVPHLLFRGEIYTAYTPYQPEVAQGSLQIIYEFQTMIAELTGMDVANASMYDGSTALAEAALMAVRVGRGKRNKLVISKGVHPEYHHVLETYNHGLDIEECYLDLDLQTGTTPLDAIRAAVDKNTAAVLIQYPNFFGSLEDVQAIADIAHAAGALLCVSADPIAITLLKSPGELGADIVTGEGQSLGIPVWLGGPYVGFFATKDAYIRQMPGRICGRTVDMEGREGFVLTLQAREQHIRREKATSNICTNEALVATAVAMYLTVVGKGGLRQVSNLCYQRSHFLASEIAKLDGYEMLFSAPFFREFAVRTPLPPAELNKRLWEEHGIIGGYDLSQDFPEMGGSWLLTATEMNSRQEIDQLLDALRQIGGE
ncbi:MAG: aminomethyl-transferring glycine dehydrogenase subunit GcvPA [Ardenticatenales bacterium]|nr:aminomethyl-transferring glycine dehydrogenase subunit GcvPA [Ardenticatenales bacterium]